MYSLLLERSHRTVIQANEKKKCTSKRTNCDIIVLSRVVINVIGKSPHLVGNRPEKLLLICNRVSIHAYIHSGSLYILFKRFGNVVGAKAGCKWNALMFTLATNVKHHFFLLALSRAPHLGSPNGCCLPTRLLITELTSSPFLFSLSFIITC